MRAAESGEYGMVLLLLENGARADMKISLGETALYIAEQRGHGDVVSLLRKHMGLIVKEGLNTVTVH